MPIDSTAREAHKKKVIADREEHILNQVGILDAGLDRLFDDPNISDATKAAAFEAISTLVERYVSTAATGASVDEVIKNLAGISGDDTDTTPAGALTAANSDTASSLSPVIRNAFATMSPAAAGNMAKIITDLVNGNIPVYGDQIQAVIDLSAALDKRDFAVRERDDATRAHDDAKQEADARKAVIDSIKAATRDAKLGSEKVVEIAKLSPEARSALGI